MFKAGTHGGTSDKFSLSPAGAGWVIWRSKRHLPKDLIFELHYPGSEIVPNYELPPDLSDVEILRVVVKETFSEVLVERLVSDIVSPSVAAGSLSDSLFID